ncbi:MAG: 23S rRNA (uracil(1939)-C(5))-methyltransferase RlmD [Oligoflexia bacterium]|nr:23S rRNA (uracil(1939)-C(5))-methyltransferase RlmD [Oligoflexia bacterium]
MSKRHPINEKDPPVAKLRDKRRRPTDRGPQHGHRPEPRDRMAAQGPRYQTRVLTPDHWHQRGEAVVSGSRQPGTRPFDEKPVDVWGGIPGEAAQVEMLHTGRNRVVGRFFRPAGQPHRLRREPPCQHYTPCGGCPFMHLQQEGQVMARLSLVRDALTDVGLESLAPATLTQGPDGPFGYRHTVKLTVGRTDQGHIRVGTFTRHTHRVVPIPDCHVATPTLRLAMSAAAHAIIELDIWPFEPQTGRGTLRHLVMRQSRSTGHVLVTIVAGSRNRSLDRLAEQITQSVHQVAGVHLHLNADPGNAIFARDEEDGTIRTLRLGGQDQIEERLGGITLAVGPGDFYQANPGMAEQVSRDLLDLLTPDRQRPVVDLYCGVGGFSLALGRAHGWALGVESVGGAVRRAKENARRNRVSAEFIAGDTLDLLPELRTRLESRHPVVLVDPSRRGLGDGVIPGILSLEPARIAYLSCNPRALARDLDKLQELGWTVRQIRAYDMFPQTAHVETLAILDPPLAPPTGLGAPRRRVVR